MIPKTLTLTMRWPPHVGTGKRRFFCNARVFQAKNQGRMPDTGVPYLQNGSAVMDFQWDPFDDHVLAVGQ